MRFAEGYFKSPFESCATMGRRSRHAHQRYLKEMAKAHAIREEFRKLREAVALKEKEGKS